LYTLIQPEGLSPAKPASAVDEDVRWTRVDLVGDGRDLMQQRYMLASERLAARRVIT
tara:strand:+ start:172 stop:342 length:171 start_codon:yes stop_codon:yes gene_type:complete